MGFFYRRTKKKAGGYPARQGHDMSCPYSMLFGISARRIQVESEELAVGKVYQTGHGRSE